MNTTQYMGRNQLIDRLSAQVGDRDKAIEILQKRGHLYPGTMEFTPQGKARNAMTAEERALDRASKASGLPAKKFKYNPLTNKTKRR